MDIKKTINKLCTPAYFYFVISAILYLLLLGQNLYNGKITELCAGSFSCVVSNVVLVFILNALYISFWTFVLKSLCDHGLTKLSWFLVLFPFLLFAVMLGLYIVKDM